MRRGGRQILRVSAIIRLRPRWAAASLLCCLLLGFTIGEAESGQPSAVLSGKVVRVRDGDSLLVRVDGQNIEVRLADVDAPERGQPYADQARRALIELVQHRHVTVDVVDTDQYRRKVSRVRRTPDGLDINAEVVRLGNAWVYRRYVREQALFQLEQGARAMRAGLWALPEEQRIPPWIYRETERQRLR